MDFEIVGAITEVEIIAVNVSIRELSSLKKNTAASDGGNSRAPRPFVCQVGAFARQSCIVMRLTASASAK